MVFFLIFFCFFLVLFTYYSFNFFQKRNDNSISKQLKWITIFSIVGGVLWMLIDDLILYRDKALILKECDIIESLRGYGLVIFLKSIAGIFVVYTATGIFCIPFLILKEWLNEINNLQKDLDNLGISLLYFTLSNVILSSFFLYWLSLSI